MGKQYYVIDKSERGNYTYTGECRILLRYRKSTYFESPMDNVISEYMTKKVFLTNSSFTGVKTMVSPVM